MHGYRCSEELKVIQFHFENIEYPYKNQSRAKEINKISKVRYLQSSKNEQLQLTRLPDENPKKKKKKSHTIAALTQLWDKTETYLVQF